MLRRSRTAWLLGTLLSLTASGIPAGEEPQPGDKPRLVLEGTPRLGFRPLEVMLTATLHGVSRSDTNFCHVDEVWTVKRPNDPAFRERVSARRPRCHHPPEQQRVSLRFYKDVRLSAPGVYTYKVSLEPHEGEPVRSNPLTIQVLERQ